MLVYHNPLLAVKFVLMGEYFHITIKADVLKGIIISWIVIL